MARNPPQRPRNDPAGRKVALAALAPRLSADQFERLAAFAERFAAAVAAEKVKGPLGLNNPGALAALGPILTGGDLEPLALPVPAVALAGETARELFAAYNLVLRGLLS